MGVAVFSHGRRQLGKLELRTWNLLCCRAFRRVLLMLPVFPGRRPAPACPCSPLPCVPGGSAMQMKGKEQESLCGLGGGGAADASYTESLLLRTREVSLYRPT